mgnify:CR=1 FL=1
METLLINLRNKKLSIEDFRKAADKVAVLLAKEVAKYLSKEKVATSSIVLVPVLRSGVVLLHPFLQIFLSSKVGFIGLKRNEKTLKPKAYYHNLPKIKKQDKVIRQAFTEMAKENLQLKEDVHQSIIAERLYNNIRETNPEGFFRGNLT